MKMPEVISPLLIVVSLLGSGCASNSQHAKTMPGVDLSVYQNFFVVEEADDSRNVGEVITDELRNRQLRASVGQISDALGLTEVLVFYDTNWHWDMTPKWRLSLNSFCSRKALTTSALMTSET